MSEINLFRTSGMNPAGQPAPLVAKKPKAVGTYSMSCDGAHDETGAAVTIDPGSCVTAELPVYSGAGQIYDANHQPAKPFAN